MPANHPLRKIWELVREVRRKLNRSLTKLYPSSSVHQSRYREQTHNPEPPQE